MSGAVDDDDAVRAVVAAAVVDSLLTMQQLTIKTSYRLRLQVVTWSTVVVLGLL